MTSPQPLRLDGSDLQWFTKPGKYVIDGENNQRIKIYMDAHTDFWQKTYYTPTLIADNGHLFHKLTSDEKFLIETEFTLEAKSQFDQACLMIRKDKDHWIKAGLEYVDGAYRLSCVVTNEYSDWSTQAHQSGTLSLRLYKLLNDVVMEYKNPSTGSWDFCRICHLDIGPGDAVQAGVMACAPGEAGGSVQYEYLSIQHVDGFHHTN